MKKNIKLLKKNRIKNHTHSHYDSHFSFFFLLLHNFHMVPQAFTVDGGETAHASDLPCSPCASSCVQNVDKKLCNSKPVQLSFSPCFIPRLLRMRTRFQKHVLLRSSLEPTTRILGRRPWADSLRPSFSQCHMPPIICKLLLHLYVSLLKTLSVLFTHPAPMKVFSSDSTCTSSFCP